MPRRPVPGVIKQYAAALGLDPRAVESVGFAESGLRRDAIGDQGTSFGPFQLHQGGALPGGRGAAWAGSDAGIQYAMQQMARYARGRQGQAAVKAIVQGFERPAAPGQEINRAMKYYRGGAKLPKGASQVAFGLNQDSHSNGKDVAKLLQTFAMNSVSAYVNSSESGPDIGQLFQQIAKANDTTTDPTVVAQADGTQTPYGGAKGAKAMLAVIAEARRRGLRASENPYVDKVDPVHVQGSDHYKTFPNTKIGHALDMSGNPKQMMAMFKWLEANRGRLGLKDEFYDPAGYSYDEGKRWNKTIGHHGTHVHASIF